MGTVSQINARIAALHPGHEDAATGGGGGGGYNGDMEARVSALEDTLTTIKSDLDVVKSNYATKSDVAEIRADLHKMDSSIKTWTLATMLTIIGTMLAAIFGVAQVFKTAGAPATPQQASAPIIIQMPAPAPPPTSPK